MQIWTEFLATQQISALRDNNTLCALDATGLLYVGGEDASDFLQNQLSNDIRKISPEQAQLSTFSNAKGRMLGIMRVIQIEGGYLLVLPRSILPAIQQELQKFIIRSRVVLADITDSFACFALNTDNAQTVAEEIFPDELNQVHQSDSLISLRLPGPAQQFRYLMLINDAQEAIDCWKKLATSLAINDARSWRLQEILAGIPTLYPETAGAFVLQMSNLQIIDGVSFKKGCFPGQEVVARMQYLGKLKRRMFLAETACTDCPAAGDELSSRSAVNPDGSGKIVDAVELEPGRCILLFIAQIEKTEAGELVLVKQPSCSLSLLPLPYAIPA
ncbi:MAG: folate-binding protein YgfZ [Gammaproteobacteria bacterium]|nr:folate-binding protein YgfZ [Gammaproteobacteria bacterium]